MKKLLLIGVIVLVVVVVIAIVVVLNLGKLVETGVERGGSMVLGVETELEGASVSLLGGTVGLDGLRLGSPEGFDAPAMFELSHAHATVDLGSLRSDEIVVHEVVVDGAEITLEFAGGKTNWGALMDRLEREPAPEEEPEVAKKKVRIERMVFTNGKVHVAGIPLAGTATVPLPSLELKDLGSGGGKAASVRNVLADLIGELHNAILTAASDVVPAEELRKLGEDVTGLLGGAGAAAGQEARKAGERATGLFKGVLGGDEKE